MNTKTVLTNKKIPKNAEDLIVPLLFDENKLFAIVGDLNLKAKYDETCLVFTETRFMVYDKTLESGICVYNYSDIEDVFIKRMYGNACLFITVNGKKQMVFRFTYATAALCDMAALFIARISAGSDLQEEMDVVEGTYEKVLNVCPKCGRNLLRPGAECIMCRSKTKIAAKLLKYVAPQKNILIICSILSIVTTAMSLVPPYVTKIMVDTIIPSGNLRLLAIVVCSLFASYVVQYGIGMIRSYNMRVAGDKMVAALRNDIYKKAQYLPMKFYDKTSTGSVITRISSDSSTLQQFMLRLTQEVVVQFFLLIGIMVIMLIMNWKLTILSLLPIPLVVLGTKIFAKKVNPYYRRIWRRWSAVTSILADSIPCIRVIKSFAGEERATEKFESYNNEWLRVDTKLGKIATAFPNIVSFVVTCGSLAIWIIGGSSAIKNPDGLISVGLLVSFISYTTMFYGPVNFFANLSDSYQSALSSCERVLDILEAEPEGNSEKALKPESFKGEIEFRNVSFSFDRTKRVLSNINLKIKQGEVIGIVGTTGSGKSTLINLLMRFYDGYEGDIFIDGINIKDVDIGYYRSKIGYVQQDPMMFSDTIYNNISYGVPGARVEEVIHAADVANAHGFITRLPDAYDTILGERGVGVSGGERQSISIARAVLKNPNILIFDEATAAVDSETENLIQQAIDRLISGRTTLMIAHRLSTLRKADRIIVVDNGEIIENGTPQELMALKGKYYKLIEIQSMADQVKKSKEEESFE